jgi:Protein of unknown function (DUF1492).
MNYIKEAENYLHHYRDMKRAANNAKRQVTKIKSRTEPKEVGSVKLDVTGVRGSSKEVNTYDDMYKLTEWVRIYKENMKEIEHIAKILQEISDEENEPYKDILEYWYVERLSRDEICEKMNIGKSAFYEKKEKAIQKLALSLFGIRVVKTI